MKILILTLSAFIFSFSQSAAQQYDSIGVEVINGKKFIIHKVKSNETLYSVSRRYDVPISKIIASNPPTEYGLEVEQIIKVPVLDKVKSQEVKPVSNPVIDTQTEPAETSTAKGNFDIEESNHMTTAGIIKHVVTSKETLFSVSRKYDVKVDQIKEWNQLTSNSIDIGQVLIIKKITSNQPEAINNSSVKSPSRKIHIVGQKETLYSLSKQYNVSIGDLKKWNGLQSNELSIGQELIVGKNQSNMNSIGQKQSQKLKSDTTNNETMTMSQAVPKNDANKERMSGLITSSNDFEEIIENGTAALIEGSGSTRKYLALHRTAKVGTIMRIHNEMNGQEVFVRVLGKLPDTGINNNIVIRISKSAYDRLGAIDPKFRVKISYIP